MWSQQNSTECGNVPDNLTPGLQHTYEREEPPRRVDVEQRLAVEPFLHHAGALVVDSPSGHVDRLDLGRWQALHGVEVALADLEVVLHHLPEGSERKVELRHPAARLRGNVEDEPLVAGRQRQPERAFGRGRAVPARQIEGIVLQ